MNVWLADFDKIVKVNGLQEITDPMMFDVGNVPTPGGLFSTEIFGVTSRDRKETFAYINLKGKYLNPKVYITLKRLNRNFENVIYSTKKYSIKGGELIEDPDNGGTGLAWLYKNWESIKFERNDSRQRGERIDVLKNNPKDVLFTDKFLVIPAFYRDVNLSGSDKNPRVPEINDLYAKILRQVKIVEDANNMDFIVSAVAGKIQDLLVDVYNLIKEKIQGKSGYLRKFALSKSIDYSSRVVLTAVPYNTKSEEDQDINFYSSGIPLSHVCSTFTPFMIFWVSRWFKVNVESQASQYMIQHPKHGPITVRLDNPVAYFNNEFIEKHLDKFVNNTYTRFDRIEVPIKEADREKYGLKGPVYLQFNGRIASPGEDINTVEMDEPKDAKTVKRDITWTDIFYQAALDVVADKHVWVTRYPMLDYFGSFPSRITVISTRETKPMMIGGKLYPKYPVIDPDKPKRELDSTFRDTVTLCPLFLPAIGGDHDGDQITIKSVFSQEANEECEKIINNKTNILSIEGIGVRNIGNEGIQTLYSMTRFHQ